MPTQDNDKTIHALTKDDLEWRDGTPIAKSYGDIYFSVDNGLEESSYVFVNGIGAPDIWSNHQHFVIGETGFGTGLNFLNTWKLWKEKSTEGKLTFISVEAFPMDRESLKQAHSCFPAIKEFSDHLIDKWPPPETGQHCRHFENGDITLILLFGQAEEALSKLDAHIDAWYLDGFAPSKNPDMWNDNVFDNIARLSKNGARLATFTAAGFVKRGLQDRGFKIEKTAGYGRKRERLIGTYDGATKTPHNMNRKTLPDWALPAKSKPNGSIAIIGAGIAGAMTASALKTKGRNVTVFASKNEQTVSNIPAALMAPRISRDPGPIRTFQTSAYAYALAHPVLSKHVTGSRRLDYLPFNPAELDRNKRLFNALDWGKDWLSFENDILTFKQSGTVNTETLLKDLLTDIEVIEGHITGARKNGNAWTLKTENGVSHTFDIVIYATGKNAPMHAMLPNESYTYSLGQVEILSPEKINSPNHMISYGDHISSHCPSEKYASSIQVLGSSFQKLSELPKAEISSSETITSTLLKNCEEHLKISNLNDGYLGSWCGLRTNTPDFLPYVGGIPHWEKCETQFALLKKDALTPSLGRPKYIEGLYLITGFGSKGYQYAPLLAEYLAAQICGTPSPLAYDLWRYLCPYRFSARALIRS